MAFAKANLYNVSGLPPGFATYTYKSDTDVRATVETAGYFNNSDDDLNLAVDDEIVVIGDQGGYTTVVTAVSSGSVTTVAKRSGTPAPVAAGSTLTVTRAEHDGKVILLDTATGSVVTLPAATGTGMKLTFIVSVTVTSNVHAINCDGTDEFIGHAYQTDTDSSDALVSYPQVAADDFDGISMNGTTTGGLIGDRIELIDIAAGSWACLLFTNGNGTVATPIS